MSQIKVGDLVVVIRGHRCFGADAVSGMVSVVDEVITGATYYCLRCNDPIPVDAAMKLPGLGDVAMPFSWIKRIPPLSELDDVKQDEELTA